MGGERGGGEKCFSVFLLRTTLRAAKLQYLKSTINLTGRKEKMSGDRAT